MPSEQRYGGPKHYMMMRTPDKGVSIFGFDDFTYDGISYDNPSRELTSRLGGQVVKVDWDAVENLKLSGPAIGIGLDPSTKQAYINGSAFGRQSSISDGPDAGDYECGHLYARLLDNNTTSLFVHIPPEPGASDMTMIKKALARIRSAEGESNQPWATMMPWGRNTTPSMPKPKSEIPWRNLPERE